MKCFVAGGTGVLGRRVVPLLVAAGHDVTVASRSPQRDDMIRSMAATPTRAEVFSRDALAAAVAGHECVINLATHIPPLRSAARRGAWQENDRIRTEGVANLITAARHHGVARYVQESVVFSYEDAADRWIDECAARTLVGAGAAVAAAERATTAYGQRDGDHVVLRFAQFYATDSAHTRGQATLSRVGINPFFGDPNGYLPVVGVDAAARAVVAAVDVESGVYNVVDADPPTRRQVAEDIARAIGRRRLRTLPVGLLRRVNPGSDGLMRSQRVSGRKLTASGWRPDAAGADGLVRAIEEVLR